MGINLKAIFTRSPKKRLKTILSEQPLAEIGTTDEEIWNVVTNYGKYQEVWSIYRTNGLLEAIKARDEKAEFDRRVSESRSPNQSYNSPPPQNFSHKPVQKNLDELDLALMQGVASYFEDMAGKIRQYHRDHQASKEEAQVIASYYLKTAGIVRGVKTEQDLKELLRYLETLKTKVSRYNHQDYKYRWSTGLEKEILVKLQRILA